MALVSLSKALLVLAFVALLVQGTMNAAVNKPYNPSSLLDLEGASRKRLHFKTEWVIYAAVGWITLTLLWSDAPFDVWVTAFMRHARLLVLPIALYCMNDRDDVMAVLRALVITQLTIVLMSCLLWLGIPVPMHNPVYPTNFGLVINGHLEQPIMSTLMLVVLWHFKDSLFPRVKPVWIYLACTLTVANVLFVMTGRTGFIAMILAMTLILVKHRCSARCRTLRTRQRCHLTGLPT